MICYSERLLSRVLAEEGLRKDLCVRLTSGSSNSDMQVVLSRETPTAPSCPVILAYEGGQIIGWTVLYWVVRQRSYLDVFVAITHRKRGVGTQLLTRVLELAHQEQVRNMVVTDHPIYRQVFGTPDYQMPEYPSLLSYSVRRLDAQSWSQ